MEKAEATKEQIESGCLATFYIQWLRDIYIILVVVKKPAQKMYMLFFFMLSTSKTFFVNENKIKHVELNRPFFNILYAYEKWALCLATTVPMVAGRFNYGRDM